MPVAGKHLLVTGATSGIGRAATLELAEQGARITLLCRDESKAEALAGEIAARTDIVPAVLLADMTSMSSVRGAALEFIESGAPLDILLNNAGIVNTARRETADGFEETLAVNHLAPFLLTGLLLPRLLESPAARIVNVSSAAHQFCRGMQFDDLQSTSRYRTFNVYGRSKLANILFTRELAQRLGPTNITANALHPGAVSTALGTQNSGLGGRLLPLLLKPFFKSPAQGAATSVFLCADESVAQRSGAYFANGREITPRPWARDDAAAARLWQVSETLLDFRFPLDEVV